MPTVFFGHEKTSRHPRPGRIHPSLVRAQNCPPSLAQGHLAPVCWPTFRYFEDTSGNYDTRVAAVQYLLRSRGFFKGRPSGDFDLSTEAAVKSFQKARKIRVDGIAGPQTLQQLVTTVKRGSKGDAVRAAQILASGAKGNNGETPNMGLDVDGNYGAQTQEAVRIAQTYQNFIFERLTPDGIMGTRSWCLLLGGSVVGYDD